MTKSRGFTLVELMVVIRSSAHLGGVGVGGSRTLDYQGQGDADRVGAGQALRRDRAAIRASMVAIRRVLYALLVAARPRQFPAREPRDIKTIPTNLTPAEILWFCLRGYTSDLARPVDFFNANAKRDEFDSSRRDGSCQTRRFAHNTSTMTRLAQEPAYIASARLHVCPAGRQTGVRTSTLIALVSMPGKRNVSKALARRRATLSNCERYVCQREEVPDHFGRPRRRLRR